MTDIQVLGANVTFVINLNVVPLPQAQTVRFPINLTVRPAVPVFERQPQSYPYSLEIVPIALPLRYAFLDAFNRKIDGKIENFYDQDRVLKTVLNFGDDYQALVTAWGLDPDDSSNTTLVFKLYRPLPRPVPLKTDLWVSREISLPLIDQIYFVFIPGEPTKLYLRPPNKDIKVGGLSGNSADNVTELTLYSSGAFNDVNTNDRVLEEWFVTSLEGAELNIDYTDYTNFVFFSSAEGRINAFANKLLLIEDLDSAISFTSSSLASSSLPSLTSSLVYNTLLTYSEQKQAIIRSFDGYERFLYYGSGSAYSSSFNKQEDDVFYYNPDATWPKVSGTVAHPTSSAAQQWLDIQLPIAQEYDKWNVNYLVNNIPDYLRNDAESDSFLQFLRMVGHQFDAIKFYIDAMSLIYDRNNNPNIGLSKDLVWNVAKSVGLDLPNQYSIEQLFKYTIGETNTKIYRDIAAETWKRFLHNHVNFVKSRGTRQALRALLNTYGILPTTIRISETSTVSANFASHSFEYVDEYTNSLNLSSSFVQIPWSTFAQPKRTIDVRFSTRRATEQTLLQAGTDWALTLQPSTGSTGYVALERGSSIVLSSSLLDNLTDGTFYYAQIVSGSGGITLRVARADLDVIEEFSETFLAGSSSLSSVWNTPTTLTIGTTLPTFGAPFIGLVDEFRVSGEETSLDVFKNSVRYPGLYNGNSRDSAYNNLWVRLSFNSASNLGATNPSFVANESPWILNNSASSPYASTMTQFTASGFTNNPSYPYSYDVSVRESIRFSPVGGGTLGDDNKIVIADPPRLRYINGETDMPILSVNDSIVHLKTKQEDYSKANNVIGFYYSISETINDSIIRSIGNVNVSDFIGDPQDVYRSAYADLAALNTTYWQYYAYSVDTNRLADFVKNLLTPVFEQAEKLVPARSKLLTGFVVEPHILERNKITPFTQPQVAGGGLNRAEADKGAFNLKAEPVYTSPTTITGQDVSLDAEFETTVEYEVLAHDLKLETTIDQEDIYVVSASIPQLTATISQSAIYEFSAENPQYSGAVSGSDDVLLIQAEYPLYGTDIDVYNDYVIASKLVVNQSLPTGSLGEKIYSQYAIEPYSNFVDIGSYTYFTHPLGYVAQPRYDRVRLKQNILNDRGTWSSGSTYREFDFVLDSSSGTEFYVHTNIEFISNLAPSNDPLRWRPVPYITVLSKEIYKAVDISGSLSLAPTSSLLPGIVGYRDNHYSFYRDSHTATLRHQFLGCLQTADTTTDGKPPVEVIVSAGDTLYVRNTSEPIQPDDNASGPILDVR